jgi:hypothetical protein
MEVKCSSEASRSFRTTQGYDPEDRTVHNHHSENFKFKAKLRSLDDITFVTDLVKIGQLVQKLKWAHTYTDVVIS